MGGRANIGLFTVVALALAAGSAAIGQQLPRQDVPAARSAAADEETAWRVAVKTDTAEAYIVFLRNFPDGVHAAEARQALKRFAMSDKPATKPSNAGAPPDDVPDASAGAKYEKQQGKAASAPIYPPKPSIVAPRPPPPPPPPPPPAPPSPTAGASAAAAKPAPAERESSNSASGGSSRGASSGTGGIALPERYEIVSKILLPTENYRPKADGMPTGVVLLSRGERAKNMSLCKALIGRNTATVRSEAEAKKANPKGDFLVTQWLSRDRLNDDRSCDEAMAKYDYDRSDSLRRVYALDNLKGPVFLALDASGEILYLDLSDATADQVYKATADWINLAITTRPGQPMPKPVGILASANSVFARIAQGMSSIVTDTTKVAQRQFNDPIAGRVRVFNIYQAGLYTIGSTFKL